MLKLSKNGIRNEKMDAERLLKSGFSGSEPTYYEFMILAKHFRQSGFGEVRIKKKIIEFCEKKVDYFSEAHYVPIIKSAIRRAIKKPEYILNRVVRIYPSELDSIRRVRNFKVQKILFSAIVHAKAFYSRNTFSADTLSSVLASSKTKVGVERFKKFLPTIGNLLDVKMGLGNMHYFSLGFCSDLDDDSFEIEITSLNEIRSCGDIYQDYMGGELGWCLDCGEEFIKSSNRHKRCSKCGITIERERLR